MTDCVVVRKTLTRRDVCRILGFSSKTIGRLLRQRDPGLPQPFIRGRGRERWWARDFDLVGGSAEVADSNDKDVDSDALVATAT